MWGRRILKVTGVVAIAFILTSAILFWLPLLGKVSGYDTAWFDTGWFGTWSGYDSYDYSVPDASYDFYPLKELKKLSPQDEWQALDAIAKNLEKNTDAELYMLRAAPDVCVTDLVDCEGLTDTKVKPFIDAVLAKRQTLETVAYYQRTNLIAGGSLFVGLLALIVSGLSYRANRRRNP
jgi:hypothetical protein